MKKQAVDKNTNQDLKIERDKLTSVINNARAELEVSQFGVKKEQKYLKNLKTDSENKNKEIEKKNNKISSLNAHLEELEGSVTKEKKVLDDLHVQQEKDSKEAKERVESRDKKLTEKIGDSERTLEKLDKKISTKEEQIEVQKKQLKSLVNNTKGINEAIDRGNKKLVLIGKEIVDKTKVSNSLDKKIEEVEKTKAKLLKAKDELSLVGKNKSKAEKETEIIKEDIKKLDVKKVDILVEVEKESRIVERLNKREQIVNIRENVAKEEEKRIKKMGATLQKHFDNNGMKHIKVFKK